MNDKYVGTVCTKCGSNNCEVHQSAFKDFLEMTCKDCGLHIELSSTKVWKIEKNNQFIKDFTPAIVCMEECIMEDIILNDRP